MDYTKNYRLPQWVKSDRIMMDDFNAAMNSMEAGLDRNAQAAANAQADANRAINTANAAEATALASSYTVGTYTGDGSTIYRTISLGFKPSFVIITCQWTANAGNLTPVFRFGILSESNKSGFGQITNSGFQVRMVTNYYPVVNESGIVYSYIAFR